MDEPAQRLWVLERSDDNSNAGDNDVCHFLGAIAVLRPRSVAVTFVRSAELRRASEVALGHYYTLSVCNTRGVYSWVLSLCARS